MPTDLTRKHFELIAAELRKLDPGEGQPNEDLHVEYVGAVAGALQRINPRFDGDRFYDACRKQGAQA